MTCDDPFARLEELRGLQPLAPDPRRADRVRLRCRAQLGRNRTHQAQRAVMTGFARRTLASVAVGGFCVLYIAALVTTIIHLFR